MPNWRCCWPTWNVDEARVLTEAAIFADKTAVDEETVRLHSHIAQYRQILNGEGPVAASWTSSPKS